MTDLAEAFLFAAEKPTPADKMTGEQAWAMWFDCLHEVAAAARNKHPLRCEDLFEMGV